MKSVFALSVMLAASLALAEEVVLFDRTPGSEVAAAETAPQETTAAPAANSSTEEVVLFDRTPETGGTEKSAAQETPAASPAPAETAAAKPVVKKKARASAPRGSKKTIVMAPRGSGVTDIIPAADSGVRLVPVAKPGYISGVTATGETVMIPLGTANPQVVTTFNEDLKSDLKVTGRSFLNSKGQAQVVVPAARAGYISGVTPAGEIVLIPTAAANAAAAGSAPEVKSAALVASTAPAPEAASAAAPKAPPAVADSAPADQALANEVAADEALTAPAAPAAETAPQAAQSTTRVVKYTTVPAKRAYAALVAGIGGYPEASNVNTGYDLTGAAGYYYRNYIFEAGVGMAKNTVNVRNYSFFNKIDNFDVDQYRAHLAGKYRFAKGTLGLGHRFQPVAGALVSYTQRQYNLTNPSVSGSSANTGSSSAVDAGLTAALDYEFSPEYALGFDFKYMFNLSRDISASYANPNYGYNGTAIESLQYYIAGISAKMNF